MPDVTPRPIRRLLVANRGEIACRIVRTAHELGIMTAVVYADPDRHARHVRLADTAVPLEGSDVASTYLDVAQLIGAAQRCGADALHPGYGFLAEDPGLARAVVAAGLTWVGPDPEGIAVLGSKLRAKALARASGVPLPPATELVGDDPERWLRAAAEEVGYPLLVKAAAGGGGRGMRLVTVPEDLAEAVPAARREARAAFGDPTVFAERHLTAVRHVEVQVLGDRYGAVVHLGERECSVQRRHQKVLEESPSPGINRATRERLLHAAVTLAGSVGYVGAGTVEFLVSPAADGLTDSEQPAYFLEMNTRLQVEHPVTEAVTGLDLVALQLRIAEGHPLPFTQEQIAFTGHAIEARVCAEEPAAGYLPSAGWLSRWAEGAGVRWDSGVEEGDEVVADFDPLLAKAIAYGTDRAEAAGRLRRALQGTVVHGVRTNLSLLVGTLGSAEFAARGVTTDFLDRHPDVVSTDAPSDVRLAHAAAAALHAQARRRREAPVLGFAPAGWRNVGPTRHQATFRPLRDHAHAVPRVEGEDVTVSWSLAAEAGEVRIGDWTAPARVCGWTPTTLDLELDGLRSTYVVTAAATGPDETEARPVWVSGRGWTSLLVEAARYPSALPGSSVGGPTAPVPGTVTAVLVAAGAVVAAGEPLVVLEAMKMEHRVTATTDCVVESVLVAPGDAVQAHQLLVRMADEPSPREERA